MAQQHEILEEEYGPFWQPSHVTGVPISVGGRKAVVNVNLEDGGRALYCEATREVALRIAPLLVHHRIRAHGTGRYLRDADGHWQMRNFRITEFEILDAAPLDETIEHLRSITRQTGLEKDIIARLAELREA